MRTPLAVEDPEDGPYDQLRRDCQTGLRTTMLALLQALRDEGLT